MIFDGSLTIIYCWSCDMVMWLDLKWRICKFRNAYSIDLWIIFMKLMQTTIVKNTWQVKLAEEICE